MRNFWRVFVVLFHSVNDIFSLTLDTTKKPMKPWLKWLLVGFLGILIFVSLILPMVYIAYEVTRGLVPLGLASIVVYFFLPVTLIMVLVFSLFTILSQFYLSSDNLILLPLPIKPWQIVGARFVITIITMYFVELIVLIPVLYGYALAVHATIDLYFYYLVIILVLPILPVSFMTLVISLLMRGSTRIKNKDMFSYGVTIFALVISLGFSFGFQYMMIMIEENPDLLAGNILALSSIIEGIFHTYTPFLTPYFEMITHPEPWVRFLNFIIVMGVQVLLVVATVFGVGKIYIKGIMSGGENPGKKKKLSSSEMERSTVKSNRLVSYIVKEWRLMLRSPVYFLNLIFVNFLMPVIIGASVFSSSFASTDPELEMFANFIKGFHFDLHDATQVLGILGAVFFLSGTSMISATSISREGKNAWFMRMIPVRPLDQIHAKIFWGLFMAIFSFFTVTGITLILGNLTWWDTLVLLVVFTIAQIFMNYLGIWIDLRNPKLLWDNEAAAVKNNLNGVLYMFLEFALGGLFGGLILLFQYLEWTVPGELVLGGTLAVFLGLNLWMISHFKKNEIHLLDRI